MAAPCIRPWLLQRDLLLDQTWLRSTMGQKRYNSLSVLNAHTDTVDNLSLIEVVERFANAKEGSRNEFGMFTEKHLH